MIIKDHQSILIPVDFSKLSYIAVKQTYNLAKYTKSKLVLLHISVTSENDKKDELEALAHSTAAESGLVVETKGAKGEFYETIIKIATERFLTHSDAPMKKRQVQVRAFGGGITVPKFLTSSPPIITLRTSDVREAAKYHHAFRPHPKAAKKYHTPFS